MQHQTSTCHLLRRVSAGAYALCLFLLCATLAVGCGPNTRDDDQPTEETTKAPFDWKSQVVDLSVTNAFLMLGETVETQSSGTGVIIAPGLMLTDAEIIWRAAKIVATNDKGETFDVERILAIDMERGLALLAVNAPNASMLGMLERPDDPRSLRGTSIQAVGSSKRGETDLGISVHDGIINNITTAGAHPIIFHNANISTDSEGGPLLDADGQTLLGLNYGINHSYRFSMAVPSWAVQTMVASAEGREGHALEQAFQVDEKTELEDPITGRVCLDAGTADRYVFPSKRGLDVGIRVEVEDPNKPFAYNLYYAYDGSQMTGLASSKVFTGTSNLGFTTPKSGYYVVEMGNVSEPGSGEGCAQVSIGAVDWDARFAN